MANAKTEELRQNKKKLKNTIKRVSELLDGLGEEKVDWIEIFKSKKELYKTILGDALMPVWVIAYLGVFFK